ncbi:hypothetical protein N9435_08830 [Pseudomonadales bacterium]|nr:hypothetical protein [Pseudomonadales bacterium]MDC0893261.1 hypothetical protein [Pseudomonadales bacterium]
MITIGFAEMLWFIILINGAISKIIYKTVDLLNEEAKSIPLLFILLKGAVAPKYINIPQNPNVSRFSKAFFSKATFSTSVNFKLMVVGRHCIGGNNKL